MTQQTVSIVVPAFNEEGNLLPLHAELERVFADHCADLAWELIIVDDGSTDGTATEIGTLCDRDNRVRGIHLARNFGQQAALVAGLEDAEGDAVITMDADMEQPPVEIVKMIALWRDGQQVIHSVRTDHPDTPFLKKWTSRMFYRVFSFLTRIPMEPGMLDFRLMDRKVVDAVRSMPESDFFLRGITNWIGFRQVRIPYQSGLRQRGKTKYSMTRMISFAIRGITSFSTFPLRLATYIGALMTLFSIAYGLHVAIAYFFWEHPTPGYASTTLLISFFMGVQFLLIGLLGEYVARIHVEVKGRPRYFVARRTENEARSKSAAPISLHDPRASRRQ